MATVLNTSVSEQTSNPAPSLYEIVALVILSDIVFLVALHFMAGSLSLVGGSFGDNAPYLQAASAIRHWHFDGVTVKQFWGLPYFIAAISLITGSSERVALVVVCVAASFTSLTLCHRLWGGWVAAFFALVSLDWFQRSLLGGAEPLFMALLFSAFLALRQGKWFWSAVLGALATVVRPFGVVALVGLAVQLLLQRKMRECAGATLAALAIGIAYAWPLAHYMGSPFANVTLYQKNDWHGGLPFTFPLIAILRDTFSFSYPFTNLVLTWGWILFVLFAFAIALRNSELQSYAKRYPAELCFVCLYGLAIYTYDAPEWARSNFPRFAIPMLPWCLYFVCRYLPRSKSILVALAIVTPILASASAVGIRNVVQTIRR
jgi:hypothetical protein